MDFGNVLSECIELFKQYWTQGLLTIIIICILTIPIALISQLIIGLFGVISPPGFQFGDFDFNDLSSFYGVNALYNLPFSIISTFIQIAVLGGFYRIIKVRNIEKGTSDDYFYFFKKEYLSKILMLVLVHSEISLLAQMLCFIPYIYAIVPLMYFAVIFAFNSEKSVEEIFKASFLLGNKKWLLTFGSLLICVIIGMLGLIAFLIGILFIISIVYLPCYVIYRDVVGFDDDSELNQIGKNTEF